MRITGAILGIIAGALGLIAAIVTLFSAGQGTMAAPLWSEEVWEMVILGVAFSALVLTFGIMGFWRPRGAGLGLILSAIGAAIFGGNLVALAMIVAVAGGVFSLVAVKSIGYIEGGVDTAPWPRNTMTRYGVISILFPIFGIAAGTHALIKSGRHQQGTILYSIGLAAMMLLTLVLDLNKYDQPSQEFLQSKVFGIVGGVDGIYSVEETIEGVRRFRMNSGEYPKILGWVREDNVYWLHVVMNKPLAIKFVHVLNDPNNGKMAVLDFGLTEDGSTISGYQMISLGIKPIRNDDQQPLEGVQAKSDQSPSSATEDQSRPQPSPWASSESCQGLDTLIEAGRLECASRVFLAADRELNEKYKQVMAGLDQEAKRTLKGEQIAWINDKERSCQGQDPSSLAAMECQLRMTEERLQYLNGL